jgi:hypothetical protein
LAKYFNSGEISQNDKISSRRKYKAVKNIKLQQIESIIPKLKSRSTSSLSLLPCAYDAIITSPSEIKYATNNIIVKIGKISVIAATASSPTICPAATLSVNIKIYALIIETIDATNTDLKRVEITVFFSNKFKPPIFFSHYNIKKSGLIAAILFLKFVADKPEHKY